MEFAYFSHRGQDYDIILNEPVLMVSCCQAGVPGGQRSELSFSKSPSHCRYPHSADVRGW